MIGSNAVIGLPGDSVLEYELDGYNVNMVVQSSVQDLKNTSIYQLNGMTILDFTRPLSSANGDINPDSLYYFLYASNNGDNSLSFHTSWGSYYFALSTCDSVGVPISLSDQILEAESACNSDISEFEFKQVFDDYLTMYWTVISANHEEYIKARLVYLGLGWVAWALSPDREMLDRLAVIGIPEIGVSLYDLNGYDSSNIAIRPDDEQTLTSTSITQENSITTVDFTRPLASFLATDLPLSSSETNVYIWAYRTDNQFLRHSSRGGVKMNLGSCSTGVLENEGIYVEDSLFSEAEIHGIVMAIAWMGLIPSAMLIARFGRGWKLWFYAHFGLQISAFILVIIGFVIAYRLPTEEDNHFYSFHGKLGLAIIIAMIIQISVALCRPKLPLGRQIPAGTQIFTGPTAPPSSPQIGITVEADQVVKKILLRQAWEIKHAIFGLVMLLVAFYNIHDGIELLSTNVTDLWIISWGIVAFSFVILYVFLEVTRYCKPNLFILESVRASGFYVYGAIEN
jgi:hypothetical protein